MQKNKLQTRIIRKKKFNNRNDYHGGSWKLAYADFVTALMAFFLLLWLLSATPNKKLQTVAQYFIPTLSFLQKEVKNKDNDYQYNNKIGIQYGVEHVGDIVDVKKEGEKINVAEINNKIFSKIESQIDNLIQDSQGIQQNISYKNTLNGLEITINDQDKHPLFQIGSSELTDYAKNLLDNIIKFIKFSPNLIQISGYTDKSNQSPLVKYGDWELSSDRADSARRYLLIKGISPERIHSLIARADTDLIDQDNPYSPINRRITITLLRKEGAANYKIATPMD